MLTEYFLTHHRDDLIILLQELDEKLHYPLYINLLSLSAANSMAAKKIMHSPRQYLPLCDKSAVEAQEIMLRQNPTGLVSPTVKRNVHMRIRGVPRRISPAITGQLCYASGIVVRMSQPTILKLIQRYLCRKCEHITVVQLDFELQNFPEVKLCEACNEKSITLVPTLEFQDSSDYQELKIQDKCRLEFNNSYSVGLQIILLDDLLDKCVPGDNVEISGVVIRRWLPLKEGARAESTMVMLANGITVLRRVMDSHCSEIEIETIFKKYWEEYKDDPLVGRNKILASLCPQLFGMYTVKIALAVVLAGGVPKINQTGVRVRGEPHLLMIGDPGTGKSQLLRTTAKLAPRAVLTTGIGTTAAGLTAAAIKDTDGWHLEAGALVLADGGVCCVDEFTTMNSNDRAALHEAMEQQTISIAKAGLVSTLNSRCSVVAATNPLGGKFVDGEEMQTRLGYPLLSRFDLILHLKDTKKLEWDKMTSDHVLKIACEDENEISNKNIKPMELLKTEGIWKIESLREYFAHIHSLEPILTQEAEEILSAVFMYHRMNPNRQEDRTTIRLMESLIRLAEGHARLMYRTEVTLMDAIVAAQLVGTGSTENDVGCPFPENPRAVFNDETLALLKDLDLEHLSAFIID